MEGVVVNAPVTGINVVFNPENKAAQYYELLKQQKQGHNNLIPGIVGGNVAPTPPLGTC